MSVVGIVILTVRCLLTKFTFAIPLPNAESETIARALIEEVFLNFGFPKIILTDQGSNFISKLFSNFCTLLNIKKINTTAFRPQTNGSLERFHRSLNDYLKHFTQADNWDEFLKFATFSYNSTKNNTTKYTPFFLMFGREPLMPTAIKLPPNKVHYSEGDYVADLKQNLKFANEKAKENILKSQVKNKIAYDKNSKENSFAQGELVKLRAEGLRQGRSKHLEPKFIGPYMIIEKINEYNYRIKMGRKSDIVHVDRLEKYY